MTMLHRGFRAEPSYNGPIAVEEDNGVIVAATLTNNPADYEALGELIEQTEAIIGASPERVVADSGFSSHENLFYLEEKDIAGYIPDQKMESIRKGTCQHPEFQKSRFTYNEGKDSYICPTGKVLLYKGLMRRKGKPDIRVYRCTDCPQCNRKGECTKSKYRMVIRDPREFLMQKMRNRLASPEGRRLYSKRKYMVEPIFGDMKYNRNMRGTLKAMGEFLLMCIAHNLRKIAKYLIGRVPHPIVSPIGA